MRGIETSAAVEAIRQRYEIDVRVGELGKDSNVGRVFELSTDSHDEIVLLSVSLGYGYF